MLFAGDYFLLLVQNVVFREVFGFPDMLRSVRQNGGILLHGLFTVGFCTLCGGMLAIYRLWIPEPYFRYGMPLLSVLTCGLADILLLLAFTPLLPKIAKRIAPVLHNAAFSGTVLGIALQAAYGYDIRAAFRTAFHSGLGFFAASLMLALAVPVLCSKKMPQSVRGERGIFLYAGLLAMASACMK